MFSFPADLYCLHSQETDYLTHTASPLHSPLHLSFSSLSHLLFFFFNIWKCFIFPILNIIFNWIFWMSMWLMVFNTFNILFYFVFLCFKTILIYPLSLLWASWPLPRVKLWTLWEKILQWLKCLDLKDPKQATNPFFMLTFSVLSTLSLCQFLL